MGIRHILLTLCLCIIPFIVACSDNDGDGAVTGNGNNIVVLNPIVVNSLTDAALGRKIGMTFRAALHSAASGQPIVFDPSLDGGVIELSIVGDDHSILKGEVMGMRLEPSGMVSYLEGYFERDYGKSALYARKNVIIDASELPNGITLKWVGVEQARVLGVYGDLTMTNVNITGGASVAEALPTEKEGNQPYTLGRGGGVAVWGLANLSHCSIYGNYCQGDFGDSRDRGAFGGGVYADVVNMDDCIVSGNTILGAGAAGGGVYSVGGAEVLDAMSTIDRSSLTGNHISAIFSYGGGVYSDGGGIGNAKTLSLTNCTIARNLADGAGMPGYLLGMGYWRGGGAYASNGNMVLKACTVVENQVHGLARTGDLGKPNMAGGVAATIGNAHAVEDMNISHSIIAGNTVHPTGETTYAQDIFTGSLLYFKSRGYNRFGVLDFSQILVPVGEKGWASLSRKHYPKKGDMDGIILDDVLDLTSGVEYSNTILSAGVDSGNPVVLSYQPRGEALDQIPLERYFVYDLIAEYWLDQNDQPDTFLFLVLDRIENYYDLGDFADTFIENFEDFLESVDLDENEDGNQPYTDPEGNSILTLEDTLWFGPSETWPKELPNYPYIEFWHRLDLALADENIDDMGPELLGDQAWASMFWDGSQGGDTNIIMKVRSPYRQGIDMESVDQTSASRPVNELGDMGAIEAP